MNNSTITISADLSDEYTITTPSGTWVTASLPGINDSSFSVGTSLEIDERITKLEKLFQQLEKEAEIRARHPTVDKAYREYQFLLNLAKNHVDS